MMRTASLPEDSGSKRMRRMEPSPPSSPLPAPPERRISGLKRRMLELANTYDEEMNTKRTNRFDSRLDVFLESLNAGGLSKGHAIMKDMRAKLAMLDSDDVYRTKDQRIIQHQIMGGLCKSVYGGELTRNEEEIKQYNQFEAINAEIFLTAPRRGGKTQAIVQICAVMLLCIPKVHICAFAPSSRAAGGDSGLLDHVKSTLATKFKITKFYRKTDELLSLKFTDADIRKFHSYPAGATNKYVFSLSSPSLFSFLFAEDSTS